MKNYFNEDIHTNKNGYRFVSIAKTPFHSFPFHYHKNFEIIFVKQGRLTIFFEDSSFEIAQNQGVFILPNQIHSFSSSIDIIAFIGVFSTSFIPNIFEDYANKFTNFPVMSFDSQAELVFSIENNLDNKFVLTASLCLYFNQFIKDREFFVRENSFSDFSYRAIDYIESNIQNDLSFQSFCNYFSYNSHYMSKKFKLCFGTTFTNYLIDLRLEMAKKLIKQSNLTFTQISSTCGFQSIRTFNRQFQQKFKTTPSKFRHSSI